VSTDFSTLKPSAAVLAVVMAVVLIKHLADLQLEAYGMRSARRAAHVLIKSTWLTRSLRHMA